VSYSLAIPYPIESHTIQRDAQIAHGTRATAHALTRLSRDMHTALYNCLSWYVEEYKGTSARQNLQYVNGEAQQTAKAARALRFTSSHTFRTSVPFRCDDRSDPIQISNCNSQYQLVSSLSLQLWSYKPDEAQEGSRSCLVRARRLPKRKRRESCHVSESLRVLSPVVSWELSVSASWPVCRRGHGRTHAADRDAHRDAHRHTETWSSTQARPPNKLPSARAYVPTCADHPTTTTPHRIAPRGKGRSSLLLFASLALWPERSERASLLLCASLALWPERSERAARF
jgi:hypothetical protein